jgi:signal peptidase II
MKKLSHVLVPLLFLAGMVGLDQWTKYLTIQHLSDGHEVKFIGDAVVFSYMQNRGMAWGFFQNAQFVLCLLTVLAIAVIIFLYVRTPFEKEYRPIRIAEVMLVGGALGNLIDRIFRFDPAEGGTYFHGYVVDMIYVKAINFPVFNVADIFVSLAFLSFLFLLVFVYNEDEFNKCFGNFKKKEAVKETAEAKEETKKEPAAETESAEETEATQEEPS